MHGLNTYDYGARQYYSIVPAWDRIDPLCEKYYSVSPYAYCCNNPIKYVDPDGEKIVLTGDINKSLDIIKSTIPSELRDYVKENNGVIESKSLESGLAIMKKEGLESGNYSSLYELASNKDKTVEFSITDNKKQLILTA